MKNWFNSRSSESAPVKAVLLASSCVLFVSCGGGGGGSSPADTPDTDTPVETPIETPVDETPILQDELTSLRSNMADNIFGPGYGAMVTELAAFNALVGDECDSTANTVTSGLQEQWLAAHQAWQYMSWVNFGDAIINEFASFNIEFYPDTNSAVERAVDNLLVLDSVDVETVSSGNSGGQGFPALEYLLFEIAEGTPNRCNVVSVVGTNLQNLAQTLSDNWSEGGVDYEAWVNFEAPYAEDQSELQVLVDALAISLEVAADQKLLDGIEGNASAWQARWADVNAALLTALNEGIVDAYTGGDGYGLDDYLSRYIEDETVTALWEQNQAITESALAAITTTFREAGVTGQTGELEALEQAYQDWQSVVADSLAPTVGITLSFNSLDGD